MFHNMTNPFQHLYAEPYQHQMQETQSLNYNSSMCSNAGDAFSTVQDPLWMQDNVMQSSAPNSIVSSETRGKSIEHVPVVEGQPITPLAEKSRLTWNIQKNGGNTEEYDSLVDGNSYSDPIKQPGSNIFNSPDEPTEEPKIKKKKIELVRKKYRYNKRRNSTGEYKDSISSSSAISSPSPPSAMNSRSSPKPGSINTKGGGVQKTTSIYGTKKSTISSKRRGRPPSTSNDRKGPKSSSYMQDAKATENADAYAGDIEPALINQSYASYSYPYYPEYKGDYATAHEYQQYQYQQYYQQYLHQYYSQQQMGAQTPQQSDWYNLRRLPLTSPTVASAYGASTQYPQYLTPPVDGGIFASTESYMSPQTSYNGSSHSLQSSHPSEVSSTAPTTPTKAHKHKTMGFEIDKYFNERGIDPSKRELIVERMKSSLSDFLKLTAKKINEELCLKERKKNDKASAAQKEEEKSIGADMLIMILMDQFKDSNGNNLNSLFD